MATQPFRPSEAMADAIERLDSALHGYSEDDPHPVVQEAHHVCRAFYAHATEIPPAGDPREIDPDWHERYVEWVRAAGNWTPQTPTIRQWLAYPLPMRKPSGMRPCPIVACGECGEPTASREELGNRRVCPSCLDDYLADAGMPPWNSYGYMTNATVRDLAYLHNRNSQQP